MDKDIILFDEYWSNEMEAAERAAFEERLRTDLTLKKEYDFHVAIIENIKKASSITLQQNMDKAFHSLERQGFFFTEDDIEDYLFDELSEEDKKAFELRLGKDPEFAKKVEFEQKLKDAIKQSGNMALQENLNKAFAKLENKGVFDELQPIEQPIAHTHTARIFRLSHYSMAMAASLLLVVIGAAVWYNNNGTTNNNSIVQNVDSLDRIDLSTRKSTNDTINQKLIEPETELREDREIFKETLAKIPNSKIIIIDAFDYKNTNDKQVNSFGEEGEESVVYTTEVKRISAFLKSAKGTVIIYYSGHGVGAGSKEKATIAELENLKQKFNTDYQELKTINDKLDNDINNEELRKRRDFYSDKVNAYKKKSNEIDWHIALTTLAIKDDTSKLKVIAENGKNPYSQKANEVLKEIKNEIKK